MQKHVCLEEVLGSCNFVLSNASAEWHPEVNKSKRQSYLLDRSHSMNWAATPFHTTVLTQTMLGQIFFSALFQHNQVSLVWLPTQVTAVLTIPAGRSASSRWWCQAHTPCRVPTGLCRCNRCWKTGSCGTSCPGMPSVPACWRDSGKGQYTDCKRRNRPGRSPGAWEHEWELTTPPPKERSQLPMSVFATIRGMVSGCDQPTASTAMAMCARGILSSRTRIYPTMKSNCPIY